MTEQKPRKDRNAYDRAMSPVAVDKARTFYANPDRAALMADTLSKRSRKHRHPEETFALALLIAPSFVPTGKEDDRAAVRAAATRAAARAAVAVERAEASEEATALDPADLRDDTVTRLTTYAPDPASAYAVRTLDYAAQALLSIENEAHRETMRRAAVGILRDGLPTLTTAADPRGTRDHITKARAALAPKQARILADPYDDGTGPTLTDWTPGPGARTGSPLTPAAQPTAATLATLAARVEQTAQDRDAARLQLALAHMDGITGDELDAAHAAHQHAAWLARRAAAGLAHAEQHARRAAAQQHTAQPEAVHMDPRALTKAPARQRIAKKDRPTQVPRWTYQGGTARPLTSAVVAVRLMDTGTPGTEITRVTITLPNGDHWLTRYAEHWTDDDTRAVTRALTTATTTDALSHVERILTRPTGPVRQPSRRARNRTGGTGPTVPAYGMTR